MELRHLSILVLVVVLAACSGRTVTPATEPYVRYPVISCVDLDDRYSKFSEETFKECMDRQSQYINRIYRYHLTKYNPKLEGTLMMDVSLQADGTFSAEYNSEGSTISREFSMIIIEYLTKATFPRTKDGWAGSYPINFFVK